eukprot:2029540-Prymnesium_polylepis.1
MARLEPAAGAAASLRHGGEPARASRRLGGRDGALPARHPHRGASQLRRLALHAVARPGRARGRRARRERSLRAPHQRATRHVPRPRRA